MFKFFDPDSKATHSATVTAAPGRVRFDDRGNAVYAWQDARLEQDGTQAELLRERALLNPALSLIDDVPAADGTIVRNQKGLRAGYNPYQSGQLDKKPIAKKRDIRELSKWIEMQRQLGLLNTAALKK